VLLYVIIQSIYTTETESNYLSFADQLVRPACFMMILNLEASAAIFGALSKLHFVGEYLVSDVCLLEYLNRILCLILCASLEKSCVNGDVRCTRYRNWTDSLERPGQRKMYVFFGTWNVWSM